MRSAGAPVATGTPAFCSAVKTAQLLHSLTAGRAGCRLQGTPAPQRRKRGRPGGWCVPLSPVFQGGWDQPVIFQGIANLVISAFVCVTRHGIHHAAVLVRFYACGQSAALCFDAPFPISAVCSINKPYGGEKIQKQICHSGRAPFISLCPLHMLLRPKATWVRHARRSVRFFCTFGTGG